MDQFNTIYRKAYTRSACLDVDERNEKEPEFLLEAPGEISIVLEHKSVAWPTGHLSDHSNEHHLFDRICALLGNRFKDSLYQLEVWEKFLKGRKKKEVNEFAKQIANSLLSDEVNAKSQRGIRSQKPIPWRFRSLSPHERNETLPEAGISFVVWGTDELSASPETIEAAKSGYAEEFERLAQDAAKKFTKYADCLKLLLVQFYGESSIILGNEEINEIILSAQLPEMIDQVWLAYPEWVSEYEYEIAWNHVR